MIDTFATEKKLYSHEVKGEAQLYTTDRGSRPSIRLMLPSLGLEFSDGHFIGPDPPGIFCYNSFSDFPRDVWSRYKAQTKTHDNKVYLNIKFFARNGKDVFAEFFALDHDNLAERSGIVGKVRDGRWTETGFGSATAHVKKFKGGSTVTITVQSIPWKAEFDVDEELKPQEVDVTGRLGFKQHENINLGAWVRWHSDHLVFYENDRNSRDYTAYFMPSYDPGAAVTTLGDVDKVFQNVKWTPTHPRPPRA